MSNLLSQLTKSEQARLLEEMNYMKRRSAHVRGVRSSVDDNQGRAAAAADARVRLPDRPPHQRAGGDWKAVRKAKATSALKTLARIAPVPA